MTAVVTYGLTKTYKNLGKAPVYSLQSLDLTINQNEVFGFLGRNGAGKTTTIKLLTGLIHATSGRAELFGVNAKLPQARIHVGYMPEQPYFYEYLTPRETIDFYGRLRGLDSATRKREWSYICELLELGSFSDRRIRGFSKGMRQKVGLAVALVGDPPLLILDEPMSGLDPLGRRMVREIILRLRSTGKTVFFSSHVLSDVEEISDRVGILVSGKLAACDKIRTLIGNTPKSYEIVCTRLDAKAIEHLDSLGFPCVSLEEDRHKFIVSDEISSKTVVSEIQKHNATLLSMVPMLESLEDFFAKLQQHTPDDNPAHSENASPKTMDTTPDE